MNYPVNSWENWYSAQGFGKKTSYGFNEGEDINLKTGGDTDLGQPLLAICAGEVTSVHEHTGQNTFGKHIHIAHDGPWGRVWCHYAHCDEVLVKSGDKVQEGQVVAKVGKTGTQYAHCHWAIKKEPTGIDGIAKTEEDLKKWLPPIGFVTEWKAKMNTDLGWLKTVMQEWGVNLLIESEARTKLNEIIEGYKKNAELEKKIQELNKKIEGLNGDVAVWETRYEQAFKRGEELDATIKEKNRTIADKDIEILQLQKHLEEYEGKVILTEEEYERITANKVLDRFTLAELINEVCKRILGRK
jgi:hypothetical protein